MTRLLDQTNSPADLKRLSSAQLTQLAEEIREELIRTVSETGGHLAPNLGVVELTIALHRVLDSPKDKIVWDVGHQSYVHKLLTGRRDRFATLRQHGGLSGFPSRKESPHDAFGAGHGSTSISAALGMAKARDLRHGSEKIVAVIGDGALTGGLAFEALNQAGALQTSILVVLNDNEMSIARNVGALSAYLSGLRASVVEPLVRRARQDAAALLSHVPGGAHMLEFMDRTRGAMKHLVVPGMLFEELGFTYLGPIDGHNLRDLEEMFRDGLALSGPVLVHAITRKGAGYPPAEESPRDYHGTPPFEEETGMPRSRSGSDPYSAVFGKQLVRLAREDSRIVGVTAAMLDGTGMEYLNEVMPDRCLDVGMAEQHAATFAAGLAAAGMRPVVAIYSTFAQRAYDQIVHDVCLQNLPVVLVLDRAGLVGDDGPTHHGAFDISYLRHVPNLTIMAPKDEAELCRMLVTALELPGPSAIRFPRGTGPGVPPPEVPEPLEVGKAEVLGEGDDVLVIALGAAVARAVEACDTLREEGLRATVVNARFAKPLDAELIGNLAARIGRVVTVEENALAGGFGSGVVELLSDAGLDRVHVRRVGLPDRFVSHGDTALLLEECGLDAASLRETIRATAGLSEMAAPGAVSRSE
ncbi:MAG: 1-deoxy-D-xylulose-5-phosphate synthase [Armatimonadetes bacterium]|nr:1-deoxy-D-xylulose-5-phosphate synthase [Armatimonadota bacterium]